jgi:malate dehydrogenase (oxaloacetate-decarboxylating)(NADP+)
MKRDEINEALKRQALDYHEFPTPGKLSVTATKQLLNQSDLALAYSPESRPPARRSSKTRSMCFASRRAAIWWA